MGRTETQVAGGETQQRVARNRQSATVPPSQQGAASLRQRFGLPATVGGGSAAGAGGGALGSLFQLGGPSLAGQGQGALRRPGVRTQGGRPPTVPATRQTPAAPGLPATGGQFQVFNTPGGPVGQYSTPRGVAQFQYGTGRYGQSTPGAIPQRFGQGGGVSVISGRTPEQQAAISRQVASFENAARLMEGNRIRRRGLDQNRALTGAETERLAALEQAGGQSRQRQGQAAARRGEQQQQTFERALALREQERKEQQGNLRLQIDLEQARAARDRGDRMDPLVERYLDAAEEAERLNRDAIRPEDQVDPQEYAERVLKRGLQAQGRALVNGQLVPIQTVEAAAAREGVPVAEFARLNGIVM